MEEPILYSDLHLHAVYYQPAGDARAAVLIVPPLFEEKRCAHRALTTCARALASAGAAVLNIDLYGIGNSRGALCDISLDRWIDDLHAAAETLRAHTAAPLTLLGCRAGALLAAHALADGLTADRIVLWQPVTAGRGYLNQLRTRRMIQDKITGETPPDVDQHEVEGYRLSPALFEGIQAMRLPAELPIPSIRLLQCSFNDKPLNEYERLITQWGKERVQQRCIISEPFWHPHSPGDYAALAEAVVEEVLA